MGMTAPFLSSGNITNCENLSHGVPFALQPCTNTVPLSAQGRSQHRELPVHCSGLSICCSHSIQTHFLKMERSKSIREVTDY